MASIAVSGNSGQRRALDSELPLVPFIDLLLCCVMFLLVSAVWNQLSALEVSPPSVGPSNPTPNEAALTLSLSSDQWVLATPEGARMEMPAGDVLALHDALSTRRPNEHSLLLASDDGVSYATVIQAIDVALGAGLSDVSLAGDGAN